MPEALDVVFVLARILDIDVARIPIALLGPSLGTPMRPEAELGVAKPFRATILLQGFPRWLKRPARPPCLPRQRRCGGACRKSECAPSRDFHVSFLSRSFVISGNRKPIRNLHMQSITAPFRWTLRSGETGAPDARSTIDTQCCTSETISGIGSTRRISAASASLGSANA